MNKDNMVGKTNSTSKLALLRQNRGVKKEVDISKAIEGFASSIDSKTMIEEIERNSAHVNLIIDCSVSMEGTPEPIAREINEFAKGNQEKFTRQNFRLHCSIMRFILSLVKSTLNNLNLFIHGTAQEEQIYMMQ